MNTRAHFHIARGDHEAAGATISDLRRLLEAHLPSNVFVAEQLEAKLQRKRFQRDRR